MSVLAVLLIITAMCHVMSYGVNGEALQKYDSRGWEARLNALKSSLLVLQTTVLRTVDDLAKEIDRRLTLEKNIAQETQKRSLLENSLSHERQQRKLLERRLHGVLNGLAYEKQMRTDLEGHLVKLKGVLKDQQRTLERVVENITSSCCVPSSRNKIEANAVLVGGPRPILGRLEVKTTNGSWGTVCDDGWTYKTGLVACRMLGYVHLGDEFDRRPKFFSAITDTRIVSGSENMDILLDDLKCEGAEKDLWLCPNEANHNCKHNEDVGLDCDPERDTVKFDVRLHPGYVGQTKGLVEIRFNNGSWGTICNDYFDDNEAKVICRMLNLPSGKAAALEADFGRSLPSQPINIDDVHCFGDEPDLKYCSYRKPGISNCDHDEDIGVDCKD